MICKCGVEFEESDSVGSDLGECQDCWEGSCADEFDLFCKGEGIWWSND